MTTHNPQPATRNSQLTVDVLDGLRLLYSGASDEAKPLLKAAMLEITRLRDAENGRTFTDFHRGDGTDDERRFANSGVNDRRQETPAGTDDAPIPTIINATTHHDNTTV